ncbi:hypothetical protein [Saccharopolyspora tripterygii]
MITNVEGHSMTTGMEGLAAGASALQGQSDGLRAAVDNGQLVMDPERAEAVAKVYDEKADEIQDTITKAQRLVRRGVYGDCFIGDQLEQKFNDKVTGGDKGHGAAVGEAGLTPILRKTEGILRDMAQTYRDSARDMQNVDEHNAQNLPKV